MKGNISLQSIRMPYIFEWSSPSNPTGSLKEKTFGGKRWTAVPISREGKRSYHKQDTIYEVHSYYRMHKKINCKRQYRKTVFFFLWLDFKINWALVRYSLSPGAGFPIGRIGSVQALEKWTKLLIQPWEPDMQLNQEVAL